MVGFVVKVWYTLNEPVIEFAELCDIVTVLLLDCKGDFELDGVIVVVLLLVLLLLWLVDKVFVFVFVLLNVRLPDPVLLTDTDWDIESIDVGVLQEDEDSHGL